MNIIEIGALPHRSRDRIRDLGEVFTPEKYVEDMLDLLSKNRRGFWSNENNIFFEPCCGHGNIVLAIYRRRLDSLYRKALPQYSKNAAFYAVANSLNTLWAIDIDSKNVNNCRTRVLVYTLSFIKSKIGYENSLDLISDYEDFFAHILSAIKWQIHENETLSSLSSEVVAKEKASKTKPGKKWFNKRGHQKMEFRLTWANFFEKCEAENSIPIIFEKASAFITSLIGKKKLISNEFSFAKFLFKSKDFAPEYQPLEEGV